MGAMVMFASAAAMGFVPCPNIGDGNFESC